MLLCQNAQTFNLEGSLVSSTPATPAVNQPCNWGIPLVTEAICVHY